MNDEMRGVCAGVLMGHIEVGADVSGLRVRSQITRLDILVRELLTLSHARTHTHTHTHTSVVDAFALPLVFRLVKSILQFAINQKSNNFHLHVSCPLPSSDTRTHMPV